MSVNQQFTNIDIQRVIHSLRALGLSYRAIARSLGVSHMTVFYWAKGIKRPTDPYKILNKLMKILDDGQLNLVDDYYSPTHNGPPNNFFSIRPGDNRLIERFKRSIKLIADFLDIQNSKLLDYVAEIGIKYLKKNNMIKLYGIKMRSFALACFRIAMYQHQYVYPEWNTRLKFMASIDIIETNMYIDFFIKLSRKFLI